MNRDYVENICSVFESYGYRQFRMSKFEEYDLYVRNKDFLLSDKIITFNDTNGKLMALKPDVTLSIIKNSRENSDTIRKVYYDENIYRVSKGTDAFREIRQIGLECFGSIDSYCVSEVIMLAARTLASVSDNYVLEISDFSLMTGLLEKCGITGDVMEKALQYIGNKNIHELSLLLASEDVKEEKTETIIRLAGLYGEPGNVLPELRKLLPYNSDISKLENTVCALKEFNIAIDFSITGNINYYNGIIFKGHISGIPESVLSGGQYDRLLHKMKRESGAIGFALYTDLLEALDDTVDEYDADTVILYQDGCETDKICRIRDEFVKKGTDVFVCSSIPEKFKYRKLFMFDGKEVTEVGSDA